jgi:flap endonuclease-1
MGVQLSELLTKKEITLKELKGKTFAVDAFNTIYQFLAILRTYDGTPLKDSHGNITSHISGLFSRTTSLMQKGLKLCFVFDGEAPELKKEERKRRRALREKAEEEHKKATESKDVAAMKKFSQRLSKLTTDMIKESKELIEALGLPVIQAPSEGEAQASYMVNKGDVYAIISQDTDSLLFGATKMIKNLSVSSRKKIQGKTAYQTVQPELLTLSATLNNLGINRDQLIALGMLIGTDFNVGGIKGIGPKNGLKLIKKHGTNIEALFKEVKWSEHCVTPWEKVFDLFQNMPTTDDYNLEWKAVNEEKVIEILCQRHDFNPERIKNTLNKLNEAKKLQSQQNLSKFF